MTLATAETAGTRTVSYQQQACHKQPSYSCYLDFALTRIGVGTRVAELLERAHGVTTVRSLLQLTPQLILATPQINKQSYESIMQCLANVGFNVPGYARDRSAVLEHDPAHEGILNDIDSPDCSLFSVYSGTAPVLLSGEFLIHI